MDQNQQLRTLLLQHLESLQAAGVQTIAKGSGKLSIENFEVESGQDESVDQAPKRDSHQASAVRESASPLAANPIKTQSVSTPSPALTGSASAYGETTPADQRLAGLNVIQAEVEACTNCPDLCSSRNRTVFGVGDPNARLCFVGEGPGADEDRIGEPFVGAAGQLLDKIISACKLSRDQVYILNTVKCRPPQNRNPTPDELSNCWPYAIRQLEIIQPEFICCLGSVAARTVLGSQMSLGRLRGQFHEFRGSKVIATYHPAYLLRTPSAKKHTWNDMKMLMAEMGIQV